MKKSAIAVAVAAALGTSAVALAETTLYGSARVSVDWTNPDLSSNLNNGITLPNGNTYNIRYNGNSINTNKYLQVWNDSSRLGVRGSEDLGSGISAIYQYEFGVNVTGQNDQGSSEYFNSNRPRWVGLKGGFGALTLGTQFTPYYNVIGYTDTFNSSKTFDTDYYLRGNTTLGNTPVFYQKGVAELRRGSSVVYTTPNWNGLSAQGMVVMNGVLGANNVDQWEANITYANGPWFVGGAFLQDRNVTYGNGICTNSQSTTGVECQHANQYGIAAGWDNKQFGLAFSWQQFNPDDKVNDLGVGVTGATATTAGTLNITGVELQKVNAYTLQGQYYFGSEVFRLSGSYLKPDNTNGTKDWVLEAGFQHNLSKRTRLWLEYVFEKQSFDNFNGTVGGVPYEINPDDAKMHLVSAGIRHDF